MYNILKNWYNRNFSNPQVVVLALVLICLFGLIIYFGHILAPILAAIILAYLLESVVRALEKLHLPRLLAVIVVMLITLLTAILLIIGAVPPLVTQTSEIVSQQLPDLIISSRKYLTALPQQYPDIFSQAQVQDLTQYIEQQISSLGKEMLSFSKLFFTNLITFGIYAVIIPIMVFFMLKDKKIILRWIRHFVSKDSSLLEQVWIDVDGKIGNYVRGKLVETGIVWVASFIAFSALGLNYAMLLSFLVGVSVIIPYVGAVVVTIPVLLIAFLQWGAGAHFIYLLAAYTVIQVIDGNILVPLLFSEAVSLHPVAIIIALVFFGGVGGAWGVFFAIPLATLVQAVLKAWPSSEDVATHIDSIPD